VLNRTKLTLAAGLVLCVSSAASAGSPMGSMGQIFDGVNPTLHPAILGKSEVYDSAAFSYARSRTRPLSAASTKQGDFR
jgi:hypothetical protein